LEEFIARIEDPVVAYVVIGIAGDVKNLHIGP
jgi:hypothetical protein